MAYRTLVTLWNIWSLCLMLRNTKLCARCWLVAPDVSFAVYISDRSIIPYKLYEERQRLILEIKHIITIIRPAGHIRPSKANLSAFTWHFLTKIWLERHKKLPDVARLMKNVFPRNVLESFKLYQLLIHHARNWNKGKISFVSLQCLIKEKMKNRQVSFTLFDNLQLLGGLSP